MLTLAISVSLLGCTDADLASFKSLGDEADITCYSGGKVVYTDTSTGKVAAGEGLYYKSKNTGEYVKNYADCIVKQRP